MTDKSMPEAVVLPPNDDIPVGAEKVRKAPDAYRTISEVAEELHIPQHRLRSWETIYPGVKPFRGESGRRYYSPEHIETLRLISDLLYVQGYKGQGVLRVLRERRAQKARAGQKTVEEVVPEAVPEISADSAEWVSMPVVIAEPTEDEQPSAEESLLTEAVRDENLDIASATEADDEIIFPELPAEAHNVIVTEVVDIPEEEKTPEAEAEAEAEAEVHDSALLITLRDENELLFSTLEKTEAENSLLRAELREILEELQNLRNLLPV
ncbi:MULTISPECIES: MerR family transcriptional regulator [Gluconobacter]|uniref:MerR family transcriptional regulator n=1 Tax=Gluconobacter cadivus TaxID=2728101 RepID=A0ABR9YVL0_9PROT|nr:MULTISPECIES: MerR family transcriptional regulator [Gluconobacter]MBF0888216.1 MerR family transcriptional regulator [Gluconobacter cadivus]MBS1059543.1 MerR family transcriptional regulator [Gluconobacter sp. Dm-44]